MRVPGDILTDFWGDTYEVVEVVPNHIRRAPDYICLPLVEGKRVEGANKVSLPAQNVRGEDMEGHRRLWEAQRKRDLDQLQSIHGGLLEERHQPWPGAQFGKTILGSALNSAIRDVGQDFS